MKDASADLLAKRLTGRWVITEMGSVNRYATMEQGGPMRVYVDDILKAVNQIEGAVEKIPSFADVTLVECREPGVFCHATIDDNNVRWASPCRFGLN